MAPARRLCRTRLPAAHEPASLLVAIGCADHMTGRLRWVLSRESLVPSPNRSGTLALVPTYSISILKI